MVAARNRLSLRPGMIGGDTKGEQQGLFDTHFYWSDEPADVQALERHHLDCVLEDLEVYIFCDQECWLLPYHLWRLVATGYAPREPDQPTAGLEQYRDQEFLLSSLRFAELHRFLIGTCLGRTKAIRLFRPRLP